MPELLRGAHCAAVAVQWPGCHCGSALKCCGGIGPSVQIQHSTALEVKNTVYQV